LSKGQAEFSTFQEGLSVASIRPVRVGRLVGRVAEWLRRQSAAREFHGFGAVIGGLVLFAPLIDGGTTQVPVLIIRLVLLTSGLIWLLGRMKAGEIFLPQTRLDVCVVVFVGWAILSLLWSPYKSASLQWVLNLLSYAALFVMVTQGIRSRGEISSIIVVVTFLGVCEGLFGIAQYLWMGETRARGTFFNPNFFAASEATVLLLSLGMLVFTKRGALSMFHRRWLWSSAAISLLSVVVAQSRGVFAALLGATLFLGMSRYGKKALVILSLCLLAVLVVPNPLQHRMFHAGAQDPYAYMRLAIWKSALIRLSDEPLGMGVGMFKQGSFQERFPIEGEIVRYRKRPESAHNEYLQMGVELGIVGLLLFLGGAMLWAAEIRHLLHESADTMDQGLLMGSAASALGLLLHSAVDSTFHEPTLVILLLILGGLVHNLYRQARPDRVIWRRIRFSYHPLRAVSVTLGALLIAAVCAQSVLAWHLHEQGKHRAAQDDLEGAFTWYVLASEIDPGTTGYHDSIARTAMQLYSESAKSEWLLKAAEEEAVARKLNPLDGRFAFRAGTVYRLMASQTLISAQRAEWLDDAADAFAEAIRLDPYSPFSYLELAELRLADGGVEEAIQLLTAATAHEPNFLPGRALLAELSLKIGIPGDYAQEMRNITAIHSQYAQQVRDEVERQFIDVDLYPLGRAIALEVQR
jgi:O-antigen ligase